VTWATSQNWRGKKHHESLNQLSKIYFQFHASVFAQRWVFFVFFFFSSIIFSFKYSKIYGESHPSLHCNLEEINLKVWKRKGWRNSGLRLLTNLHIFNHLNQFFLNQLCIYGALNGARWTFCHDPFSGKRVLISWKIMISIPIFCIERTSKIVRAL